MIHFEWLGWVLIIVAMVTIADFTLSTYASRACRLSTYTHSVICSLLENDFQLLQQQRTIPDLHGLYIYVYKHVRWYFSPRAMCR